MEKDEARRLSRQFIFNVYQTGVDAGISVFVKAVTEALEKGIKKGAPDHVDVKEFMIPFLHEFGEHMQEIATNIDASESVGKIDDFFNMKGVH